MRRSQEPSLTETSDRVVLLQAVRPNLWRYVYRAAALRQLDSTIGKLMLNERDLATLTRIHYAMSDQVRDFIYVTAPAVLRQLSQRATPLLEVGYRVRGHIDWNRTVRERSIVGLLDMPLFAVARRERDFDTPENQLFCYLLDRIISITGGLTAQYDSEKYWLREVQIRFKVARMHAASHLVRGVQKIDKPRPSHVRAVAGARNRAYRGLGSLYEFFHELVEQRSLGRLREVLEAQFLEPMELEDLFELYTLFEVKQSIDDLGWVETEQQLIGGDRGLPVFCYRRGDMVLSLLYQRVPWVMNKASHYKQVLAHYKELQGLRRPDIIVLLENSTTGRRKYLIIEAKYSRHRRYIVDGAYKLFGYLSDFRAALNLEIPPTGILVAMGGVDPSVPLSTLLGDEVILANRSDIQSCIGQVIAHHARSVQALGDTEPLSA